MARRSIAGLPIKADTIRTGCGSKLCHFGILSADKCRDHCSLCIDCRSVLGSNPEGIRTGCGQVADRFRNMRTGCGFTKLDSASCPHLDVRFYTSEGDINISRRDCSRAKITND